MLSLSFFRLKNRVKRGKARLLAQSGLENLGGETVGTLGRLSSAAASSTCRMRRRRGLVNLQIVADFSWLNNLATFSLSISRATNFRLVPKYFISLCARLAGRARRLLDCSSRAGSRFAHRRSLGCNRRVPERFCRARYARQSSRFSKKSRFLNY